MLSVVIPVMNEEDNIAPMLSGLGEALKSLKHEIIFVDDGSSDDTVKNILKAKQAGVRLLEFSRNYGQTSAMAAGIEAAVGDYIVTLDGDLQNDPSDIPVMLEKLKKEKLDLVAGCRKKRQDGFILRKIPSKIANYLIRKSSGVDITDIGCTLKVFKADLAKKLDLYGELHRFIPVLASMHGAKIGQMDVKHHARQFGETKYGLGRTFKVISDILLMMFFIKYRQKPMHLFGGLGVMLGGAGGLIGSYLLALKIFGEDIGHRPLFFIAILCVISSVQLITTGFIAELMMRTYYGAQNKRPYSVSREYKAGKEVK